MSSTVIERAFELARAGQWRAMTDIHRQLTREGFEAVHQHLSGAGIIRQLRQFMKQKATGA